MKPIAYIFAVVLGLTLMQSPAPADDRSAVSLSKPQSPSLEAGRKAVEAKNFKSALGHLTQAAKETPEDGTFITCLDTACVKSASLKRRWNITAGP